MQTTQRDGRESAWSATAIHSVPFGHHYLNFVSSKLQRHYPTFRLLFSLPELNHKWPPPHLIRPFATRFFCLAEMFISNTKCVNINSCYTILLLRPRSLFSVVFRWFFFFVFLFFKFGSSSKSSSSRYVFTFTNNMQTHKHITIIQIQFILERQHHSITWWFCLFFRHPSLLLWCDLMYRLQ